MLFQVCSTQEIPQGQDWKCESPEKKHIKRKKIISPSGPKNFFEIYYFEHISVFWNFFRMNKVFRMEKKKGELKILKATSILITKHWELFFFLLIAWYFSFFFFFWLHNTLITSSDNNFVLVSQERIFNSLACWKKLIIWSFFQFSKVVIGNV